jgi:hypothetical protein
VVAFDDPALEPSVFAGAVSVSHGRLFLTVREVESDIWVMDLKR